MESASWYQVALVAILSRKTCWLHLLQAVFPEKDLDPLSTCFVESLTLQIIIDIQGVSKKSEFSDFGPSRDSTMTCKIRDQSKSL